MKILKYILHILVFMIINILTTFVAPTLSRERYGVFIILAVVLAAEYVYVWFSGRKYCFSVPLSYVPMIVMFVFYFNNPENADMALGMWVILKFLTLPYLISALAVSAVMKIADMRIKRKNQ